MYFKSSLKKKTDLLSSLICNPQEEFQAAYKYNHNMKEYDA
jgi:hypothetical protein